MMAAVSAEARRPDGSAYARPERRTVVVPLTDGEPDRGLVKLFWVHGWAAPRSTSGELASAAREAATTARGGTLRWELLCPCLGGELPRLAPTEAATERAAHTALSDAVAQAQAEAGEAARREREARRRRRAAREAARGDWGAAQEEGEQGGAAAKVGAAAALLGVPADATRMEVRSAYLKRALRAHPDKGGDAAVFRALHEAMEELQGLTPAERREAAEAGRRAEAEAKRAAEREEEAVSVEEAEEQWNEAERERREAEQRAETAAAALREWTPTWRRVAAHVDKAGAAYFDAWRAHRKETRRARERSAREEGFDSDAQRRATGNAEAKRARAAARVAAREEEVNAMREAERRTSERLAAERAQEAVTLRERAGRHLLGALADWWEGTDDAYRVKAPYAWWCHRLCRCPGETCSNWTSRQYEEYRVARVIGNPNPEGPAEQEVWITLEREGAQRDRSGRMVRPGGGDRLDVSWRVLAGGQWFGAAGLGFEIEWEEEGEEGEEADEEER